MGEMSLDTGRKKCHGGDSQTLEEVTQRGCGICVLGGTRNSARWDHWQPSLADCCEREVGAGISGVPCLPESLHDPILSL